MLHLTADGDGPTPTSWAFEPVVDLLCDLGFSAAELDGTLPPELTAAIVLRLGGALALDQVVQVERLELETGQSVCTLRTGAGQLLRPCLATVASDGTLTELWWRAHRDLALYAAVAPMAAAGTAVPQRCGPLEAPWRALLDAVLDAAARGATLHVGPVAGPGTPGTVLW